ncbi:MAG: hypothetical protein ACLSG9_02645 [Eubacterium sp.]
MKKIYFSEPIDCPECGDVNATYDDSGVHSNDDLLDCRSKMASQMCNNLGYHYGKTIYSL